MAELATNERDDPGSEAPRSPGVLRVAVENENEVLALGLQACVNRHPTLQLTKLGDEELDVAVVSPQVARTRSIACPLVVCGDAPTELAPHNVVLAVLRPESLTPEQVIVSVQAAAAGLQVAHPGVSLAGIPQTRRRTRLEPVAEASPAESDLASGDPPVARVAGAGVGGAASDGVEADESDPVSLEVAIKAISDPQRRRILAIVSDEELSAGEIALHFDVSRPAISQHLQTLRDAGLVSERRKGTRRLYRVRPEGLRPVESFLDDLLPSRLGMPGAGPVVGPVRESRGGRSVS